ncbi:Motility accessory factor [hydrothermal vent metagenome]|uniref:Motility accessory factor n=1 Tax=hydrothermal vent metagenome TaxID=652676 RepID=A0A3B1BNP7_9ZZZZ
MTVFEENLAAIRKHSPELAKLLAKTQPSARIKRTIDEAGRVTVKIYGPDGNGTLRLPDIHKPSLNSAADELANARMVALLGFGSGSLLAEVVDRASDQAFILLIEPDIDFFTAVLKEVNIARILKLERVSLSIGENPAAATFARAENEFGVFTCSNFSIVENRWSAKIYSSFFNEVKERLEHLKEYASQNILTMASFGVLWQKNILQNLPAILKSGSASTLFERYKGIPAAVVSAGPSLDKTAFKLSVFKENGLVIAVDTAVRALLSVGVTPDIVVSLDAKEENYFHLAGIKLPDTLMVLNPVAHPKIVEEHVGPKVFIDYADPLFRWLETVIGEKGTIRSGGSVATSAFDLAIKLGCSPIVFVGQDMSYIHGRTHAGETTHESMRPFTGTEDRWDNSRLGDDVLVESYEKENIFGELVFTNPKMDGWRKWFELIIGSESIDAYNATEGGIEIKGATNVALADISARLPRQKSVMAISDEIFPEKEDDVTERVVEALTEARDEAREVKRVCGKGIAVVKETLASIEKSANTGGLAIGKGLSALGDISSEILGTKMFVEINRWSVDSVLDKVDAIRRKGRKLNDANAISYATLESFRVLFSDMYQAAAGFEREADKAVSRLKRMLPKV